MWNCSVCTLENPSDVTACQICQTPKGTSTPPSGFQVSQQAAGRMAAAAAALPPPPVIEFGLSFLPNDVAADADVPVPLQSVTVNADILDFLATVTVEQTFKNLEAVAINCKYTFPIDHSAAVTGLTATFGPDRVVEAVVREKTAAKREFDAAVARGDGAVLVAESDDSPDVFQCSVGNVDPGAVVKVKLTYVTEVKPEGDHLRFALPTAVAPRFHASLSADDAPTPDDVVSASSGSGSSAVPGAAVSGPAARLSVRVAIESASELSAVSSPSHPTTVVGLGVEGNARRAVATLGADADLSGGDFVLHVTSVQPHQPRVWVESRAVTTSDATDETEKPSSTTTTTSTKAVMLSLYPSLSADAFSADPPSEFLFCIDQSGSMAGSRMNAAKRALQLCLRALPGDVSSFGIIGFGTRHRSLFGNVTPVQTYDEASLARASRFVDDMKANMGGTEILRPLQTIFSQAVNRNRPRTVFLFTDGQVQNSRTVISACQKAHNASGTRVFTFGIGRDASAALVEGVAAVSGGASEMVLPGGDGLETAVMRQMDRALQPALTDVRVDWGELAPFTKMTAPASEALPPLYTGSRMLLHAVLRVPSSPTSDGAAAGVGGATGELPASATVTVSANGPDGPLTWSTLVNVMEAEAEAEAEAPGDATSAAGAGAGGDASTDASTGVLGAGHTIHCSGTQIHAAAARSRIRDLEKSKDGRNEAIALATEYGVACRWASFVAVERRNGSDAATTTREMGPVTQGRPPRRPRNTYGSSSRSRSRGRGRSRRHSRGSTASASSLQSSSDSDSDDDGEGGTRTVLQAAAMPTARHLERDLADIHDALDEMNEVAHDISDVLRRSEKMENLVDCSQSLSAQSQSFAKQAKKKNSGFGSGLLSGLTSLFGGGRSSAKKEEAERKTSAPAAAAPAAAAAAATAATAAAAPPLPPAPPASGRPSASGATAAPRAATMGDDDDEDLMAELAELEDDMFGASFDGRVGGGGGGGGGGSGGGSRPAGSAAAAPAATSKGPIPTTPEGKLAEVVKLQRASGEWALTPRLAALVGVEHAALKSAASSTGDDTFSTAVVLAWLTACHEAKRVEWRILARKATRWLTRNADGVDLEALQTAAKDFLAAQAATASSSSSS